MLRDRAALGVRCCQQLRREVERALASLHRSQVVVGTFAAACDAIHPSQRPVRSDPRNPPARQWIEMCMNCIHRPGGALPKNVARQLGVECNAALFLGAEACASELRRGSYLVLPGWVGNWRDQICRSWGFDAHTGPLFFREHFAQIVALDTGVAPGWTTELADMAEFVGLPIEVRFVGTSVLEERLGRAIERVGLRQTVVDLQAKLRRSSQVAADYAAVSEFVGGLSDLASERHVVEQLRQLCHTLMAPSDLSFASAPYAPPSDAPEMNRSSVVVDAASGRLEIALRHRGVHLGTLAMRIDMPQSTGLDATKLSSYAPIARVIGDAAAMALTASRLHSRERQLVSQLRDTVSELDSFVHMASHDLRSPVLRLSSLASMLVDLSDGQLPDETLHVVHLIERTAASATQLVDALLNLSRASNRPLRRVTVELDEVVDSALEALKPIIDAQPTHITRDKLPAVAGDATLLAHLFQNLLGNALKYCNSGERVIAITCERRGRNLVFGVRDNGIGIPTESLSVIFEPFKRLHGDSVYEGSGIGLALCRKVVTRHGGRIWAESQVGVGTHILFTIGDLSAAQQATPQPMGAVPSAASLVRVWTPKPQPALAEPALTPAQVGKPT